MLTDLGPLLRTLSAEAADLKNVLKAPYKVVVEANAIQAMPDHVQKTMTNLIDKQEYGEHVLLGAEYALKFKKTRDKRQLDETVIENLIADVRNAFNYITLASGWF